MVENKLCIIIMNGLLLELVFIANFVNMLYILNIKYNQVDKGR